MNTRHPSHLRSRRPGIALVLVVFVMALTAILSYAMLSASAVQSTAGSNAVAAATARSQAESGIHLAMYYLLNPGNSPSAPPCTWSNVTFATGSPAQTIPGSVTISIGSPTNNCYPVVATGSSGSSVGGGAVTRTISANICVGGSYLIEEGGAFNSAVTLGTSSTFSSASSNAPAVESSGIVTNNGHISGNISASSVTGIGTQTGGAVSSAPTIAPAPSSAAYVYNYTQPYTYQGATYNPTLIGATISSTTSYGPTTANPLGIYYTTGNLTVNQQLTISGTLIVNGTLTDSSKIYITPAPSTLSTNMPAMVVNQKLSINGANRVVSATGVVYIGQGVSGIGSTGTSTITVNGALLVNGTNPISGYSGPMNVTYNSAYTNIPGFVNSSTDSSQTIPWVKIISWSE